MSTTVNDAQKAEFIAAEKLLFEYSNKHKYGKIIINSRKAQEYIDKAEEYILLCMKDNGMIDGQLLSNMIYEYKPEIFSWISLPKEDFRLVDKLKDILKLLFGGN